MAKSLMYSIMLPYFGVIIFPLTVWTKEEYWIEWYITILFDCQISCVSLWVPYNQTPPIFMTPGEISGNTNQPGISRGFLQFCFLLLGTTKSSLFTSTPYDNRANSTSWIVNVNAEDLRRRLRVFRPSYFAECLPKPSETKEIV